MKIKMIDGKEVMCQYNDETAWQTIGIITNGKLIPIGVCCVYLNEFFKIKKGHELPIETVKRLFEAMHTIRAALRAEGFETMPSFTVEVPGCLN